VLLVRDKGRTPFMLPGGGIYDGELPEVAVARELLEETTLTATAVRYLFRHGGKYNRHHVFSVDAEGEVDVSHDPLVVGFIWWDGNSDVPIFPHVSEILARVRGMNKDGQDKDGQDKDGQGKDGQDKGDE
jgi:8-oxo-dGTP pyrophosphatase MutT (NUDIX family)